MVSGFVAHGKAQLRSEIFLLRWGWVAVARSFAMRVRDNCSCFMSWSRACCSAVLGSRPEDILGLSLDSTCASTSLLSQPLAIDLYFDTNGENAPVFVAERFGATNSCDSAFASIGIRRWRRAFAGARAAARE